MRRKIQNLRVKLALKAKKLERIINDHPDEIVLQELKTKGALPSKIAH